MAKHDRIAEPELKSQFQHAHKTMLSGDYTAAVHELSDAFLDILKRKPEILKVEATARDIPAHQGGWIESFSPALKWPQLGANLVPESIQQGTPKIEFSSETFSFSDAITYYEFAVSTAVQYKL